jgi:Flp pilus assembly pilin Flp
MDQLGTVVGNPASVVARQVLRLRTAVGGYFTSEYHGERGQGLAEYALILAFIAIVAIAALAFFGVQISGVLTDPVGEQIGSVVQGMP